jgi:hypothetical protein
MNILHFSRLRNDPLMPHFTNAVPLNQNEILSCLIVESKEALGLLFPASLAADQIDFVFENPRMDLKNLSIFKREVVLLHIMPYLNGSRRLPCLVDFVCAVWGAIKHHLKILVYGQLLGRMIGFL